MSKITLDNLSDNLKAYLEGLGLTEEQVLNLINENGLNEEELKAMLKDTMSINELSTNSKTVIGAINELFQSANNGKELIANAIGEPLDSNDTFSAMSSDINSLLSTFKTNMMNNGVTVESGDKFKNLIDKIATMVEEGSGKGIQLVTGVVNINSSAGTFQEYSSASDVYCSTITVTIPFQPLIFFAEAVVSGSSGGIARCFMIPTDKPIPSRAGAPVHMTSIRSSLSILSTVRASDINLDSLNKKLTIPFTDSSLDLYVSQSTPINWYAIGVGEEDTTLRDSLASILQEEGVSITEEDDMASLISKVDSEFDRQVVPAGNAVAANVDSGKTFINSTGQIVTGTSTKVAPAGTAVASNVLSGKTFINSTGKTVTGTMANRGGAQTVTPGTSNKTLNAGYYSGNITVKGDSNLVAANIVSGKSIFGVTGTAKTGDMQFATGSFDYGPDETAITVTMNLDFTPQYIFVLIPAATTAGPSGHTGKNIVISNLGAVTFLSNNNMTYSITNIKSKSFTFNCVDQYLMNNTITCNWYAFG